MAMTTRVNAPSLKERAYRIRRHALRMGEVQGQGYIAQALDIADILAVAYFHAMRYRAEDPSWAGRDRFLLSNGHYAIALYAALIEAGIIPEERIDDAVRRILRVKALSGAFSRPVPQERPGAGDFARLGSPAHRALAREAVRRGIDVRAR